MTDAGREPLPIASPRQARKMAVALVARRPWFAATAALALVAAAATGALAPPLLGELVDVVDDRRPAGDLVLPVAALVGVALLQALLTAAGGQLTARLGETVLADLRERVVTRALAVPLQRLERAGAGDLLSRVSGDVAVVSEAITTVAPSVAQAALTVGLTGVGLVVLDWRLALAALLAIPIEVLALRWYLTRVVTIYRRQRLAEGERTQQLVDVIGGAPTVRALGLARLHRARVDDASQAAVDLSLRAIRLWARRFLAAMNAAELVGLSAVLATGFLLVRADAITVGAATAGALYFHRAFDPIGALLILFDDLQEGTSALTRLVGIATLDPPASPARPPAPADGSVSVRGVDFAYVPGRPVLAAVDLEIRAGERVALIGTSGAGKTTLARLIAGIHEPSAGEIRLGGVPLGALGPEATRRAVALVTQEVHVFAGTILDDLRLVAPDASDDVLLRALDEVGALGWVQALPDGAATTIGDGAHRLTASEAQQLALARLVLRDPPVVILDEATAEAGSAGARHLEAAAARALRGRTALVVAHRLTQAAAADRVVVLEEGRIAEQGPPAQLLAQGGRYAALWAAWEAARGDAAEAVRLP